MKVWGFLRRRKADQQGSCRPALPSSTSRATLADVLHDAGLNPLDVLLIRHTYKADGLKSPKALTPELVRSYTRGQLVKPGKFPQTPPRWWVVMIADGGQRSRLYTVYENLGEVRAERTSIDRFYDIHETDLMADVRGRLVIEWPRDMINWAKSGSQADRMPIVEIEGS